MTNPDCIECHGLDDQCDSCSPPKHKLIRVTAAAHKRLREFYAEDGETMTDIASRLITGEMGDAYVLSRASDVLARLKKPMGTSAGAYKEAYDAISHILDCDELEG